MFFKKILTIKTKKRKAFGLIELSIVLAILAVVVSAALSSRVADFKSKEVKKSLNRFDDAYQALGRYVVKNGRLPCPASLSLKQENANYGREVGNAGDCSGIGVYIGGDGVNNNLVYGMLPYIDLNLTKNQLIDSESRMIYVVDRRITDGANFLVDYPNPSSRKIKVFNNIKSTSAEYDFILLSHGPNKAGAFSLNSGLKNDIASTLDEQSNNINPLANPAFDQNFVSRSTQENFDDIIYPKTRDDLLRDFNLDNFVVCGANPPVIDIDGYTVTWAPGAKAGENVSSINECPSAFRSEAMYAIAKCNEDGTWGKIIFDCKGFPQDLSDTVDAVIGLASNLDPIEPNLKLWLDAKNINFDLNSGLVDGSAISTWFDVSGSYNNATAVAGYQPTFKLLDPSNNNAVSFTRDRLTVENGVAIGANQPRTLIMVMRSNATASNSEFFGISTGSMLDVGTYNNSNRLRLRNSANNTYTASGTFNLNTNYIAVVTFDGSATKASVNGNEIFSNPTNTYFSFDLNNSLGIGWANFAGREFANGYMNEVMIFNKILSQSELSKIQYYLSQKWNFDSSTIDSDQDGTVDSLDPDPYINYAYFDGIDDRIVTSNDNFNVFGAYTLAFAVKPESSGVQVAFGGRKSYDTFGGSNVFHLRTDSKTHIGVEGNFVTGWKNSVSSQTINWNQENLIAFKVNDGNHTHYINGVENSFSTGNDGGVTADSRPWIFGKNHYQNKEYYKGMIYRIGIFNTVIPKSQLDTMATLEDWTGQPNLVHYFEIEHMDLNMGLVDGAGGLSANFYGR